MRLYLTDDGRWHNDSEAAKTHARAAAVVLDREVRASVCWIVTNRLSMIELLNSCQPVIRRRNILFVGKP